LWIGCPPAATHLEPEQPATEDEEPTAPANNELDEPATEQANPTGLGTPKAPGVRGPDGKAKKTAPVSSPRRPAGYSCTFGPLPPNIVGKVKKHSWRKGCPVALDDLAYMRIRHWGYDQKVHTGELIVHKDYAESIKKVFGELFKKKFPIEKMRLVDEYQGDDTRSMQANNTSAFNCRPMTGYRKKFSKHAYGGAIDVNPLYNPYHRKRGDVVEPEQGRKYLDRSLKVKGMILKGDACHKAFTRHGWRWGGLWRRIKDYQHFEIRDIKGR